MARYLLMLSLFATIPAAAQDLTVSASFTFMVTSPNPPVAVEYNTGGGTVTMSCTPCANPGNSQKFYFDTIEFRHEAAPDIVAESIGITTGMLSTATREYTEGNLPFGARLFPRLQDARCVCGNLAQVSNLLDVDQVPFTIAPYVTVLDISEGNWPAKVFITVFATPVATESVRVHITGPGVDETVDLPASEFPNASAIVNRDLNTTHAGEISVTASLMPYDVKSISQKVAVPGPSGAEGSDGSGTGNPDEPDRTDGGGCSAGGGALPQILLGCGLLSVALLPRRSRRASRERHGERPQERNERCPSARETIARQDVGS